MGDVGNTLRSQDMMVSDESVESTKQGGTAEMYISPLTAVRLSGAFLVSTRRNEAHRKAALNKTAYHPKN